MPRCRHNGGMKLKDFRFLSATPLLALPLLAVFGACAQAGPDAPKASPPGVDSAAPDAAARFHVRGDIQTLPFLMVHEFPFVPAEVDGTPGKLMFDTGTREALSLNDHLLTGLGPGRVIGRGFVGSGESFAVTLHPAIDRVSLAPPGSGLRFAGVPGVQSQNMDFLESFTTLDCLGLIGWSFFEGYLMKLDYGRGLLTFYRATAARRAARDFLKGETVLAVLTFETRRLPNHPLIHLKIGTHDFLGAFDTGQIGQVQMSAQTQRALAEERLLTPLSPERTASGPTGRRVTVCRIEGLHLSGSEGITASVSGVPVFNQPGPAAAPMGTPESDIISLGQAFLSQYKTVWDYPDKKIYLLKK